MKALSLNIEPKILNHPWYRKWECGELPRAALQHYAQEYAWQVAHFPRYLSRLHSQLPKLEDRQVVLENLQEEENRAEPHPVLWAQFSQALGATPTARPGPAAEQLVRTFQDLVTQGPAEGLGAILAYEAQVPAVAKFKSEALQKHYAVSATGTRFFDVHAAADVWHTEALEGVLARCTPEERTRAQAAAQQAAQALWTFLDAMPN
jgi:pyrroloquinoline-quinone synthase